jgi:hypothetical protein
MVIHHGALRPIPAREAIDHWQDEMVLGTNDALRIVIANEPRYYREVLAEALRLVRPHTVIRVVAPDVLCRQPADFQPQLVMTNDLECARAVNPTAWIIFPVDDRQAIGIQIAGYEREVQTLEFADIVAIVDATSQVV